MRTRRKALAALAGAAVLLGLAAPPSVAAGEPGSPGASASPSPSPDTGAPAGPGARSSDRAAAPPSGTTTPAGATAPSAMAADLGVLVFHGDPAQQEDPVETAAAELTEIGEAAGIAVDVTTDPGAFTVENLAGYRGVVFLSAEGVELTAGQETALTTFVRGGGGFLGIRDAARAQARSDWFTGLIGTRPVGNLPAPAPVTSVTASAENPPNEVAANLTDGDTNTKWLAFEPTATIDLELEADTVVDRYALTSANDAAGRDPADWTLQGSADGETWTDLDTRTGEAFADRFQTKEYEFENDGAYRFFRLDITATAGEDLTQLAEIELFDAAAEAEPDPEIPVSEATVNLVDDRHPATADLPRQITHADRWLNWAPNPVGDVHTLAQVEEWDYEPGKGANGAFHPVSWCRDYDGGRSFYTAMGGTAEGYDSPELRAHLTGALQWTTGAVRGDCQATIAENYEVERLTDVNAAGELDQIGEPHGLTIAPDGGVFHIGRGACPSGPVVPWEDPDVGLGCGTIHRWDPASGESELLTTLEVMGNRGSGDELTKNEEGLLGITLDPDFENTGWVYVFWMPHENIDRERRVGYRTVSRFTYDAARNTLDQGTRVDLLEWETQIHSCCHAGGGMDFDDEGNLYIGSGDNNSSGGSDGYSGNNWTQEYAGISFQDARRTAGNTNDLNGKILRIHPEPDGTYTIPDGNLFPESDDPGDKTRPEVYVMGVRNISRLAWDHTNGWLTAAWVGPDAQSPDPELGPAKYETATIITSAGNQGWPYCMGNRQPYRDRSNEDAEVLTGWYDCDAPKNTSPRNTGLVDLPPVRDNMIWYSPDGGGPQFPRGEDGVPSYDAAEATYTLPYLRGGGQAVMNGPTYHRSEVDTDSGVAWPEHWDGKWFLGDQSNANNRVALTVDPETVPEAGPPVFAESLRRIIPGGRGDTSLQSWMDAKFGPDGALYLHDYAGGFFSLDDNQKLIRIGYHGGPATPAPAASATTVQSDVLTVRFTGSRSGGVAYEWDFGDGSTSSEANPTHRYTLPGSHTATLTVTYADGTSETIDVTAKIACDLPDDGATVTFGELDSGVTNHEVEGSGCTVDDLVRDEARWDSHRDFVTHVTDTAQALFDAGWLTTADRRALVRAARDSDVGRTGSGGYRWLFDGTPESLDGWRQAPSGRFDLTDDGTLVSRGGLGMLWYAAEEFGDVELTMEFRDVREPAGRSNSGVLVRFPDPRLPAQEQSECGQGADEAWVAVYCGHEIQLYDGAEGEPQKTGSVYNFDPVGLDDAGATEKGVWNTYTIRMEGQTYTILRNGEVINEFENAPGQESSREGDPPTDLRQFASGFVGLQNHGTDDVTEFRNIRVKDL